MRENHSVQDAQLAVRNDTMFSHVFCLAWWLKQGGKHDILLMIRLFIVDKKDEAVTERPEKRNKSSERSIFLRKDTNG